MAVREGDFKLIERHEDGQIELYNLKDDTGERHDLTETMSEKASELRHRLHAWRREVGAQRAEGKPRGYHKVWQERTQ